MIDKSACFNLGYFSRTHSLDGTLILEMDADHPDHYKNIKSLFLELNEVLTPYFISKIKINGKVAFVNLEQIETIDAANALVGSTVFLPLTDLPPLTGNQFYYHEIIGFNVIDETFGAVGTIENIYDLPRQMIAKVMHDNKEVLIPLLEDFIIKVNRQDKELNMQLPDGLLDVYLKS